MGRCRQPYRRNSTQDYPKRLSRVVQVLPRGNPYVFPVLLETLVQVWKLDAPIAWQKLCVILCANFNMLFLPASVATPKILIKRYALQNPHKVEVLNNIHISKNCVSLAYLLNPSWEHWLP
jgi:hypothetical protein